MRILLAKWKLLQQKVGEQYVRMRSRLLEVGGRAIVEQNNTVIVVVANIVAAHRPQRTFTSRIHNAHSNTIRHCIASLLHLVTLQTHQSCRPSS